MCTLITVTTSVIPHNVIVLALARGMSVPRERVVTFEKRVESWENGRDAQETRYNVEEVVNLLQVVFFIGIDVKMIATFRTSQGTVPC